MAVVGSMFVMIQSLILRLSSLDHRLFDGFTACIVHWSTRRACITLYKMRSTVTADQFWFVPHECTHLQANIYTYRCFCLCRFFDIQEGLPVFLLLVARTIEICALAFLLLKQLRSFGSYSFRIFDETNHL
jgi:hypothetical protein